MDPAFFKLSDISSQQCTSCGSEIEFWKDDIFLFCAACKTRNTNARLQSTCISWCKEAASCIGNNDISEWLKQHAEKS
jgi:hypothetical protein